MHAAPQVLDLLTVVVIDVVPRHLVRLGVGARILPLLGIGVGVKTGRSWVGGPELCV